MFSSRVPDSLVENRLARAVSRLRAEGGELLDLTEANPTAVGFAAPPEWLQALSDPDAGVYRPTPLGLAAARAAVADHLSCQELVVDPARVMLSTSTSEAYGQLFKLLCDPGDVVLVPRPSYPLFDHLTRLEGVAAVPYALEYHTRWDVDLSGVEQGLSSHSGRARAVLVVNPNNPTGSFATPAELASLDALCRQHDAALIVDEVFGRYPMCGGRRGPSVLDRSPKSLTFSLGGLSKAVGLPQLKLAWTVAAGPEPLVERALSRLELICDTYLSVGTPVQVAAARLLPRSDERTSRIAQRLSQNYRTLNAARRRLSGGAAVGGRGRMVRCRPDPGDDVRRISSD